MAYSALRKIRFSRGGRRKGQVNIPVIYLGSVQILCPVGEGICGSVEEIFENCGIKLKRNLLPKRTLEIKDGAFELSKADCEDQETTKVIYNFRRIIYCGVDGKRQKILVFNYHHGSDEGRGVYLAHAFMCETKSAAKKLAFVVANHFKSVKFVGEPDADENSSLGKRLQLKMSPADSESMIDEGADDIELGNIIQS